MSSRAESCRRRAWPKAAGIGILACAIAILVPGTARAVPITGGIASAVDGLGNPVTPLITTTIVDGVEVHEFTTGTFAAGPFISTLEFTFTPTAATPLLNFNFSDLVTTADPTGSGAGSFRDSLTASIFDGSTTQTLLLIDETGFLADPFGTAPGSVSIGPPTMLPSLFPSSAIADLSAHIGPGAGQKSPYWSSWRSFLGLKVSSY